MLQKTLRTMAPLTIALVGLSGVASAADLPAPVFKTPPRFKPSLGVGQDPMSAAMPDMAGVVGAAAAPPSSFRRQQVLVGRQIHMSTDGLAVCRPATIGK